MLDNNYDGRCRLRITEASYVDDVTDDLHRRQRTGFTFSGVISDERGVVVGDLQRKIYTDSQGKIVVKNELMVLGEQARGKRISTTLSSGLEDIYRSNNVDRIEVAAMKDGGYAWARAGFDFDPDPGRLRASVRSIERRIAEVSADASPADQALLAGFSERFGRTPAEYPSPSELASLTGVDDLELGKTLMTGSTWHGVRVL
ncbi:hypothetical protein ACFQZZ_21645 [Nocardia sp. GCM10030253]|uniref:hypothetical protein n=1 Tax=Nocardia sp. GCM10030253 TaxID=3273404 RepID=UPI00364224E9